MNTGTLALKGFSTLLISLFLILTLLYSQEEHASLFLTHGVASSQVRLAPASSIVERTAGSLKSRKAVKSAKQLRRVAEQAIADAVAEHG